MSAPLRVKDQLFQEAEAEGALLNRSAAKQVEFWAQLGKILSRSISNDDVLALMQGIASIQIEIPEVQRVEPQEVFTAVDKVRQSGDLARQITPGSVYYEASTRHPGLLDEVGPDGSRRSGHFSDGKFIAE